MVHCDQFCCDGAWWVWCGTERSCAIRHLLFARSPRTTGSTGGTSSSLTSESCRSVLSKYDANLRLKMHPYRRRCLSYCLFSEIRSHPAVVVCPCLLHTPGLERDEPVFLFCTAIISFSQPLRAATLVPCRFRKLDCFPTRRRTDIRRGRSSPLGSHWRPISFVSRSAWPPRLAMMQL